MPNRLDDLISPRYLALLRERYQRSGWGASGYHHASEIVRFANYLGAGNILDYGCGRGTLKPAIQSFSDEHVSHDVREFDPGIFGKDGLPQQADLVVATDVLEHVEPDYLDVTLRYLRVLACRGAFFIIALSPSRETLGDGTNAHLIIESRDWWLDKLRQARFTILSEQIRKGLWVWCR
jgi:hypothetical protein